MKLKLILSFLFCANLLSAQSFKYPVAVAQGKTIKSLTPPQWKVIDSARGNLNNDHIEDLALVLEFDAAVKENRAYGDNTTEIITEIQKPRMLLIYFKSGRNYRFVTQNPNFILRSEEGGAMGDPLRPMHIENNQLHLLFEGGANWRWKLTYSFKYQDDDWTLTSAGNYSYHTGSGELNNTQYDFVNKKRLVTSGTIEDKNGLNEKREQTLTLKTLRTFSSFKKPWTWELGPDEYL
jgi:hypothetical protein